MSHSAIHSGKAPRRRERTRILSRVEGYSLVELMVVVAVLGILGAAASVAYRGYVAGTKNKTAMSELHAIQLTIEAYVGAEGKPPEDLTVVNMASGRDPWGNAYQYQRLDLVPKGKWRKDKNLVPINTDYDLWSNGPDGQSVAPLTAQQSKDDLIRANDGSFIGIASDY